MKKYLTILIPVACFGIQSNAQIVYTDVAPDTTINTTNGIYNLDLNNDGIVDFKIRKEYYYFCPFTIGQTSTTYSAIKIDALIGNQVSNDSNNYPKSINYNVVIKSGSTNWVTGSNQLLAKSTKVIKKGRFICFALSSTTYTGHWNAANDKYVGLRLIIGPNKYYGWLRLSITNGGSSVTVKDYAYDSTPNHSISAGATSGARLAYTSDPTLLKKETSLNTYPNPVLNSTTISFSMVQSEKVTIKVFDLNGKLIATPADKIFEEGEYELVWNAEDVNAGIYFLQFQSAGYLQTEKIIVAK